MLKLVGNNSYGVAEYIASTDADLANLPKDGLVGQGSTCFVIATSSVYMYDAEANEWKAI